MAFAKRHPEFQKHRQRDPSPIRVPFAIAHLELPKLRAAIEAKQRELD